MRDRDYPQEWANPAPSLRPCTAWDLPRNPPRRRDRGFHRPAGSREAQLRAPASWRECPRGWRFSSRLSVQARVDVVEEDAQRGSEWNRDEHAENSSPAESRDERDDDQDGWQPDGVTHHLGVDEVEDDVGDEEVDERNQQRGGRRHGQTDE